MTHKVKLIYNPSSGETSITHNLDQIFAIYQSYGYSITVHRLDFGSEELLTERIKECEYHHILIAGGDGTINYVVNLMMKNGISTPISVLPTGTANDFAKLFGLPSNVDKACHMILNGEMRQVDLGIVNDRYFINVFSCGLFTDVSQKTPTRLKNTFGKLAYYLGGIGELPNFRRMQLKIESDNGCYEGNSVIFFVLNGRTAGQFNIARTAMVDDGLLDVVIIEGNHPLKTLETIFHYFSIFPRRVTYPRGVTHIACRTLKATCDRDENTDIDGQTGPSFPLQISCAEKAITMLVPKEL